MISFGKNEQTQSTEVAQKMKPRRVGYCLGFLTESNKPYSVNGVTGPILKSTTEVTWAGSTKGERVSHPVRGRLLATP